MSLAAAVVLVYIAASTDASRESCRGWVDTSGRPDWGRWSAWFVLFLVPFFFSLCLENHRRGYADRLGRCGIDR